MKLLLLFLISTITLSCTSLQKQSVKTEIKSRDLASQKNKEPLLHFLVFGDTPYEMKGTEKYHPRTFERPLVKEVFPKLINKRKHAFLVHVGDVKSGQGPCTNQLIRGNMQMIANVYPGRTFYTPGDNEWTDCDRDNKTSELERLEFVMKNLDIFKAHEEFSHHLQRAQNSPNLSWTYNDVEFMTLHIPGTNGGRDQILVDHKNSMFALADKRDEDNLEWLRKSFQHARDGNTHAVVIFLHADMIRPHKYKDTPCTKEEPEHCDGYKIIKDAIQAEAKRFKKPVLLVHGDTGGYCLDQPFENTKNLWRLNSPGDFRVMDIAQVTVQPDHIERPFDVRGLLYTLPAPDSCKKR